jgi:glycosyltransferase involved in cell wall biosynthesis
MPACKAPGRSRDDCRGFHLGRAPAPARYGAGRVRPDYGVFAMRLSVVIPTRDRHELLQDCLETLGRQRSPSAGWEVLVIDDGSDDPLRPLVDRAARAGLPVRCERQPQAGLNRARNRGIESSTGEIVAFLDDDTLVAPGWAQAIDDAFGHRGYDALGGRVVLRPEGESQIPRWLTDKRLSYLSAYDLGPSPLDVRAAPLPVGANFAMTRDALDSLGGFRDGLDRVGKELISNGEVELLIRLLDRGGRIVYWPAAEVVHRVPEERLTKGWFRRRAEAQGISDVRMEPLDGQAYTPRLARELVHAGRAIPILGRRLIERRGSFDAELWLIGSRARIAELRRQRRADD